MRVLRMGVRRVVVVMMMIMPMVMVVMTVIMVMIVMMVVVWHIQPAHPGAKRITQRAISHV